MITQIVSFFFRPTNKFYQNKKNIQMQDWKFMSGELFRAFMIYLS